jgi:iron complex transport system substrate-binding protein
VNKTAWLNGGAAALALVLAAAVGAHRRVAVDNDDARATTAPVTSLTDADGHVTRVRDFRRIVSGSTMADRLLVELCEPDRVVAFTAYGAEHSPYGYQYAGKPQMVAAGDVEHVLALKPDLFITNSFGTPSKLTRLREAGVEVFDLGEARGLSSLVADAHIVAALVGHPERGERFLANFTRRMAHVAAAIPVSERHRGLYVAIYGNQFFGGGAGTSYHDVLTAAGVIDLAPPNFPSYTPEQLMAIDPEVIVTKRGMKRSICERSPFDRMRACTTGIVVEITGDQFDDPSTGMLDAAEQVFAKIYEPTRDAAR